MLCRVAVRKKQPNKPSIEQWIFYFWSFKISRNILEKSENIGSLHILRRFFCYLDPIWICIIIQTGPCNVYTLTPNFYIEKTGVYRGVHYFHIFALKHMLWVLDEAVLTCTHNICFEQKYENRQTISNENCHFYSS